MFVLFLFFFFFARFITFWSVLLCFAREHSPISTSGMDGVVLERNTPRLSYMPLIFCAVRSFPPWQTLVFTKTIVCLSLPAAFCPFTHPTAGMSGGMGGETRGRECRGGVCLWQVVLLPRERSHASSVWLGPRGSGHRAGRKDPPSLPRQAGLCRSLAAHPTTHEGARMAWSLTLDSANLCFCGHPPPGGG